VATIGTPGVAAVVLHYRNWPGVRGCLEDLTSQTAVLEGVTVVDNASADGSTAELQRYVSESGDRFELRVMAANNGYAAGMNAGIRAVRDRHRPAYVLLCTHDARLEPTCVAALVAALEADPAAAVAGPLLGWATRPGQVWSVGGEVSARTGRPFHLRVPGDLESLRGRSPQQRSWLDGALLLVRADVIDEVGLLDESFFMYIEEVEWQLRIRDSGRMAVWVPSAVAWQEPGMAPPYLEQRNRVLLYRVRGQPWLVVTAVAAGGRAALRDLVHGRGGAVHLRLRGVAHGLTGKLDRRLAARR
jgi:GT2 family glycosyltransferase